MCLWMMIHLLNLQLRYKMKLLFQMLWKNPSQIYHHKQKKELKTYEESSSKITLLRDDIELPNGLKIEDISNIYSLFKNGDCIAARKYISNMDVNLIQWINMLS